MSDANLIKRLFTEQMTDNIAFHEAEDILWELKSADNINFSLLTSQYWLSTEDITANEFESEYEKVEESEEA